MSKDKQQQTKSPKKKEQLSNREIKELMGINKPTYQRHKGAMRQR
jgi:hypothetical protein